MYGFAGGMISEHYFLEIENPYDQLAKLGEVRSVVVGFKPASKAGIPCLEIRIGGMGTVKAWADVPVEVQKFYAALVIQQIKKHPLPLGQIGEMTQPDSEDGIPPWKSRLYRFKKTIYAVDFKVLKDSDPC
jgi:hypothetical protein